MISMADVGRQRRLRLSGMIVLSGPFREFDMRSV